MLLLLEDPDIEDACTSSSIYLAMAFIMAFCFIFLNYLLEFARLPAA